MHWLDEGAYTGETSPTMLTAIGATHVLIGHSERRQYFDETDTSVNLKLKAALAHGLVPIVCVGELLAEREANQTEEVLERQIAVALEGIDPAIARLSSSPTSPSGPSAPAAPLPPRSPTKPTASSALQIATSLGRTSPPAPASSTAASVKPDNAAALCCLETSTAHSSAEPASIRIHSHRSSTTLSSFNT